MCGSQVVWLAGGIEFACMSMASSTAAERLMVEYGINPAIQSSDPLLDRMTHKMGQKFWSFASYAQSVLIKRGLD